MGDKSAIEWTDATWNPVRGCKEVSPGCDHCYARTFAERFRGVPGHPYEAGFDPRYVPDQLELPLRWTRPRHIFVNSMSDLFQGAFADWQIKNVFGVMETSRARGHIFQVLTKRAERQRRFVTGWAADIEYAAGRGEYLRRYGHVWLGTSVESPAYLERIEDLRKTPARVRFLSLEPLLDDLGTLNLAGIGWVIVGGESGPGARPMRPEWVRSIRDQCEAADVPFFFKQWGGVLKKKTGRELDGRTHDAMPPRVAA